MMENEEVIKKIDELIKEIRFLGRALEKFNPHNDKLFLLSETEYTLVKKGIKKHCTFYKHWYWWLRSHQADNSGHVRGVNTRGEIFDDGISLECGIAVAFMEETFAEIGARKIKYDFPFVYVGNDIWISENFIFWSRFDGKSNDYEKSEIRQKILKWADERSNDEK